ncbi:CBU_0592 family membrane protein [Arenimonas composti]|uniref:CBU-0592-like domain-containing protein n=1 Tax=Arenimonas composti TR7-09 = DSM 18010 TaxID=1121013 RepID=A0A091BF02_9GAMM|nr:hypothetical protein [Arenimonas composti]KFN50326.1 hypothetical protein P873_06525 [Arenimonas composti TR7-09 = DSM 18010]
MSLQWFDLVGLAGVGLVLGAFFLLQAGRLGGESLGYQCANLFGAVFILVSIFGPGPALSDVISTTIMQLAWIAISLYGLVRGLRRRISGFRTRRSPPGNGLS